MNCLYNVMFICSKSRILFLHNCNYYDCFDILVCLRNIFHQISYGNYTYYQVKFYQSLAKTFKAECS